MLTNAQLQVLKADIAGDPALNSQPNNPDGNTAIAQAYSVTATPDFYVWRTNVTRAEIYHVTSSEGTTWEWNTYKAQSVPEQNSWVQMFMGDEANFALPNLRAGVAKIFSGSAAANAQNAHCLAIGKRRATRGEKLFASGTGTQATPATMTTTTPITMQDVDSARNLP